MHLTESSSAYVKDMWGWTVNPDLDSGNYQNISRGRGFLVEATSAIWLHGTAVEHNPLYQYYFKNAANEFISMQKSETVFSEGLGSP